MDYSSAFRCNFTTNFTRNFSPCAPPMFSPSTQVSSPYDEFFKFALGSAIFLFISSVVSVMANGLLILVFFIDPLKIFRNAATYFLCGLAIVDLLTAATDEPMYAACLTVMYTKSRFKPTTCRILLDVATPVKLATMNASFLIVLTFTVTQYIVVISPLNHARKVTKKRVVICVLVIYAYAILFGVSHLMGLPIDFQEKYDKIFHNFVLTYLTIIFHILLHVAFKKKMIASRRLREENNDRRMNIERKFIKVNFLLTVILFICSQPAAFLAVAEVHGMIDPTRPGHLTPFIMINNLLYLRLLLNPFVYAWRVPEYRQALKIVLRTGREEPETRSTLSDRVMAEMRKSRDTVITLDFRSISQD